jgi:hypothetical protein
MAVTITRSVWIDDDGTGQVGTVINQALHTTLYNEIDTALAKVAQLAGGNTFAGTQAIGTLTVSTLLTVGGAGAGISYATTKSVFNPNTQWGVSLQQTPDVGGATFLAFLNTAGAQQGSVGAGGAVSTSVLYNTTSDQRLKTDRGRATDVAALRAVVVHDFTWTAAGVRDRGVFAQEAHALYPRAVVAGTDECTDDGSLARPWMTDYSKFVPDLIVGWQQHDAELAELRALLALAKGSPDAQ